MHYEGPIYRPPSEADSLLIQATVGCPHNSCTFCMVYKGGTRFKIRPVEDIKKDILEAKKQYSNNINSIFFPAGNTIAMKTKDLCEICEFSRKTFPSLKRITVYGSSQYIYRKGMKDLRMLFEAGLTRIHVGLESGDDVTLKRIKKGTFQSEQITAGKWVKEAGIELSEYVLMGIAGAERSQIHAIETARALNEINPHFVRLRTFLPKINTPLLEDIKSGSFVVMGPHAILTETAQLIKNLEVDSILASDHYTNYINLDGQLPNDRKTLLEAIDIALQKDESEFRPIYVGNQ